MMRLNEASILSLSCTNITASSIISSGQLGAQYIELSSTTPFIDFHYNGSAADYTSRIIESASGVLSINSVKLSNNTVTATTFTGALKGNADTATILQTTRTLTIGNTGKSFNGGGNVSWTIAEIGALPVAGGTMNGTITFASIGNSGSSAAISWNGSTDGADIYYRVDSSDAGRLVFNMRDDANTYFCFAYNGTDIATINMSGHYSGTAATAAKLGRNGAVGTPMTFNWSGQDGQPSWLWGGNDGTNMYVYNPSNFSVSYANSAGSTTWLNENKSLTYGANGLQYFNLSMSASDAAGANNSPTADWYHVIRMNHANGNGYYTDLAFCFHSDIMAFKRVASGGSSGWKTIIHSGNYTSYCAPASHSHSYLPLSGGTCSGEISTTSQNGFRIKAGNYGVFLRNDGSSTYILLTNSGDTSGSWNSLRPFAIANASGAVSMGHGLTVTGTISGTKVVNAVWNDYAEYFERGEETEVGDIVALDLSSSEERYVKALNGDIVAGVHSDSYGHIIGGKELPEGYSGTFEEYNDPKFIPVGLKGRVKCKVIGNIKKGDRIYASDIAGVGETRNEKSHEDSFLGYACEDYNGDKIGIVKVLLK